MKYAWIENDKIRDVVINPQEAFPAEIAKFYNVEVPEQSQNGDHWSQGVLTKFTLTPPEEVSVEPTVVVPPKVTVIEWKMLFTTQERIAAKTSTDPVIQDLQELMNDPRTVNVDLSLVSIQQALDYMTVIGILAPGRKDQILLGKVT